jgi:hypothetical protein
MRNAVARLRPPAPLLAGLVACFVGVGTAGPALGAGARLDGVDHAAIAAPQQARRAQISLDQAIEMAERRYKARVVRPGVEEAEGRRVYVLRLLSEEGRVWTVRVDAQTGAMY